MSIIMSAQSACGSGLRRAARHVRRSALAALVVMLIAVPLAAPASASAQTNSALAAHPFAHHVAEAALRFGIPESWIWSVMRAESGGNPRAVSRVGAQGLMQIMPATWAMLSARYGLGSDPFNVRANIHGGAAYLRMMWDRYRRTELMLAAYNAGPGRTDAYAAGRRGLPAETIAYVARIAPAIGTSGLASRAPVPSRLSRSWQESALFGSDDDAQEDGVAASETIRSPASVLSAATRSDGAGDPEPSSGNRLPSVPHLLFIPLSGLQS